MPTKPSYPGVYVEEISSSSQAITPVSTATAAFVGYARRGPLNQPVRVTSFAEYERHFGGLTRAGAVGYAAHQFFANGGASAVIVRVIKEGSATAASVTLDSHERHEHEERERDERGREERGGEARGREERGRDESGRDESGRDERGRDEGDGHEREGVPVLEVHARAPGHWANGLRIAIDHATRDPHETFNLHVFQGPGRPFAHESFHGLSMDPDHPRYAPAVIEANSALIRGQAVGEDRPDPSGTISRPFEHELPDLDVDVHVRIGEVEREFHLYHQARDGHRPRNLFELAALLQRKLRAQPDRPGRHAFAGAEVRVLGRRLQTVAGSLDEDDVVRFHGAGAADLGLEAYANPPVRALSGGDDGEPPGPGDLIGDEAAKTGIQALRDVDDVNLLNLPDLAGFDSTEDAATVLSAAAELCRQRRGFLLIDAPASWTSVDAARSGIAEFEELRDDHAALYFPHVTLADPITGRPRTVPPGGAVAGVMARTDTERGVWKAPAGTRTRLTGAHSLTVSLTDQESGQLNPLAINTLRAFPGVGPVVWGARTLEGTDAAVGEQAGQWAYVPVRRLALHVEESLYRGLRWVVFEPNTEQLWQQIRLDVSAYLDTLFRRGAFAGRTPREAYFVRCDATTTTQTDIANGIVNIVVGIAPVAPAEFVVVRIQQVAGLPETQ